MNLKAKIITFLALLVCSFSYAQMEQYDYRQALEGIQDQWHQIILPETIFEQVNPDFSDVKIYGITSNKDTVEAPYLLKIDAPATDKENIPFALINKTLTKDGHFFTFELTKAITVNQILLELAQQNFDWKIRLEGSQDQQDWFTIQDDYRIVSINNEATNYQYTTLNFANTKYRYYRLLVKTSKVVTLQKAQLALQKIKPATYQTYPIVQQNIVTDKTTKKTSIELTFSRPLPLSFLSIAVKDNFDFYRPITIQYLRDSIKTDQDWQYQYQNVNRSILSSLEKNEFRFNSTITKKLKIIIHNHDNPPLSINKLTVKGYQHRLITRFTAIAEYYLTYGNRNAVRPKYDIVQFQNNIPSKLANLVLGPEQAIPKRGTSETTPLFENKWWLWALMGIIIFVLGWFTLKMLKE